MTSTLEIFLDPGDVLYREGDENTFAFVIAAGEVILYRETDARRTYIEKRGPGAIIGELSILTGQPRTVTVEALTPATIYRLSADGIKSRFERIDPILRACIDTSINFSATMSKQVAESADEVALAKSTLRNAEAMVEQFGLETDITKGLERGEFSIVCQPILRVPEEEIVGFEALIRWRHPVLGDVSPERFVQIAETADLIKPLTEFTVTEVCATMQRLLALNRIPDGFFASVNISAQDIERRGFVDFLNFTVEGHDLSPHHLKLEITETALLSDADEAARTFNRLRSLGYGIAIDDFGTGYSNFAYLKALPITALKIDRAFVADLHGNDVSRSIVKLLVTLAGELGIDLIAEGLERKIDAEILCQIGCSLVQGFYFHKPMSVRDLTRLLAHPLKKSDVA